MINYLEPDFKGSPARRTASWFSRDLNNAPLHVDVSIVTPYYNTEELFIETASCLFAQSLQNWEWIIVDDGSTDRSSLDRLSGVASQDGRIKVVSQLNAGPGAARNMGVRQSSGRFICLLDSDDMVEPGYLEKCVWFLESNPEFAFCNSYSVVFGEHEYLWRTGFERGSAHIQANSGPPISVIRRSAYDDCGGFDESIRFGHEDWDFWLAMANVGHWGYTIPEFLQWYRKRGDGRFEQIMRSGDVNDQFEKLIRRKYSGLEQRFPVPMRRQPQALEDILSEAEVLNPLAGNSRGRRIMLVIPWMVTGGADRVNLDLVEGLVARGHEVTICATLTADHLWESQFSRFTPDIFILPNILSLTDYPRFLAYLIESRKIDSVLISGSTIGYQLLPYLRTRAPNVAFVDMCHVEEPHWLNGGHPRFSVGYQEALDLNIVTTGHLANWMKARGADPRRIEVLYTGIRVINNIQRKKCRSTVRKELGIADDLPVIVFAGRLCEQKRPFLLAEILKALRDGGSSFRALIVGDGELREQLEVLLTEYKLQSDVQMLGSVNHERWLAVLAASDVLLMPSKYEGISVALLEAMGAGVVPVVAEVGGQNEIVTAEAGFLIPHGPDELARYQESLRQLLGSPVVRQNFSNKCLALAESKFSWSQMIERFEALLGEAHRLRCEQPRQIMGPGLSRELAVQALEYRRVGEAADWMWNNRSSPVDGGALSPTTSAEGRAVARFAIALSQTWLGRKIIRSKFLIAVAKNMLRKLNG